MIYYKIVIDLSDISTLEQFHNLLKTKFGFPDFYGKNIHALIDCLSSLYLPEDGMSKFILPQVDDILILEVRGLSKKIWIIINNFIIAIEQVNMRAKVINGHSSILLNLLR